MPKARRSSYSMAFKIKVIAEAEAVENNSEIAREYGLSESLIHFTYSVSKYVVCCFLVFWKIRNIQVECFYIEKTNKVADEMAQVSLI